jgi:exopolysaccharide production protein ExoF
MVGLIRQPHDHGGGCSGLKLPSSLRNGDRHVVPFRLATLALVLLAAPLAAQPADSGKDGYTLGPQDRLMIRVHTLRKNAGEIYPWAALNGEFSVGANGSVSMPIMGEIAASGRSTAELAETISQTLKQKADLAEIPSASVEVIKYRPLFVTGAVQQPGKYDYQPGLTVLQAVSTAQGIMRFADLNGAEREVVTAGGDLRVLDAERIGLEAKIARLTAEVSEAGTVTYPKELVERSSEPRFARAMREESLRFDARRDALKSEVEAIEKSKVLLRQELASLEVKAKSLDQLATITQKEVQSVNELLSKGLTVAPRQLSAESNRVMLESNRLDVQAATLRAQQSLARADRDAIDVRTKYRKEALDDMVTTRSMLDQNTEKAQTAERLLKNAKMRTNGLGDGSDDPIPVYELTRITASGPVTWTATENEVVRAGDVLKVSLFYPNRRKNGADAEVSRTSPPLSEAQLAAQPPLARRAQRSQ